MSATGAGREAPMGDHSGDSLPIVGTIRRRRRTGPLDTTVARLRAENERLRAALAEVISEAREAPMGDHSGEYLLPIRTAAGESMCPFCEHFTEVHRGLPFDGGPGGRWRYRCHCGCTVEGDADKGLRLTEDSDA